MSRHRCLFFPDGRTICGCSNLSTILVLDSKGSKSLPNSTTTGSLSTTPAFEMFVHQSLHAYLGSSIDNRINRMVQGYVTLISPWEHNTDNSSSNTASVGTISFRTRVLVQPVSSKMSSVSVLDASTSAPRFVCLRSRFLCITQCHPG